MTEPKISVIVPVYNVEEYLRKCLDSIINQTLKDIEIICVEDKSTDNSLEILKEYVLKDSRIKIIEQPFNQGLSIARNTAIKNARGKYIGFVDSDDYISLNFFENLYNAAEKYNADIACASIYRVFKRKIEPYLLITNFKTTNEISEKFNLAKIPNYCYVSNKIYNRQKYLKTNISFSNMAFEDIEWTHRVLYSLGNLVTVPDCAYYYLNRNNSVVNTKSAKNISDYEKAQFAALNFCYKNNIPLDFLKNAYQNEHRNRRILNIFTICYFGDKNFCWIFKHPLGNIPYLNKIIPPKKDTTFWEWIFSIKNSGIYKVIIILGFKIKFKSKKLIEKHHLYN